MEELKQALSLLGVDLGVIVAIIFITEFVKSFRERRIDKKTTMSEIKVVESMKDKVDDAMIKQMLQELKEEKKKEFTLLYPGIAFVLGILYVVILAVVGHNFKDNAEIVRTMVGYAGASALFYSIFKPIVKPFFKKMFGSKDVPIQ